MLVRDFCTLLFLCSVPALVFSSGAAEIRGFTSTARAEASTDANTSDEKDAFESAKELGTTDAWQAFLKTYASGFRADLARAYLKKLGETNTVPPPGNATSTQAASATDAEGIPCHRAQELKSQTSTEAAKITFVNRSGATRIIQWKTFDGGYKEYAALEDGKEFTQETYLTHPWIVANGPGDCVQAFMPVPGASVAVLDITNDQFAASKPGDDNDHGPTPEQTCRDAGKVYSDGVCISKKKKNKIEKSAKASCNELGLAYRDGQCVAKAKKDIERVKKQKKKGCPKGTYLNPLGVCQPNETGG